MFLVFLFWWPGGQPVTEDRLCLIIVFETLVTLILDRVVKLDTAQILRKLAINRVNATFRAWCPAGHF